MKQWYALYVLLCSYDDIDEDVSSLLYDIAVVSCEYYGIPNHQLDSLFNEGGVTCPLRKGVPFYRSLGGLLKKLSTLMAQKSSKLCTNVP